VLSPQLFNLYLEEALVHIPVLKDMYLHGTLKAYADDIVCTFNSREEGQRIVSAFEQLDATWRLALNKGKSVILAEGQGAKVAGIQTDKKAKYLGMRLCLDKAEQRKECGK